MSRYQPRHRADPTPTTRVRAVPRLGQAAVALPAAAVLAVGSLGTSNAAWLVTGEGSSSATSGSIAATEQVVASHAGASDRAVALTWTAVTFADRYEVYRSGTLLTTVTGTSYADTLPGDTATYTYAVVARRGASWVGPSRQSNQVRFVAAPGKPVVTSSAPDSGALGDRFTNVAAQTLAGTAEPGSTVTAHRGGVQVGESTTAGAQGGFVISVGLSDGANSFTVTASNAGGTTTSDPYAVSLDTTKPVTTYDPTTKKFSVVETGSGLQATTYRIGTGPEQTYEAGQTVDPGAATLFFRSVDKAANTEDTTSYTAVSADAQPPTLPTTDPAASATVYRATGAVTLSSSDAGSGVTSFRYTDGGGTEKVVAATRAGASNTFTATITLADGSHALRVVAVDAAGNVSGATTGTYLVDSTAPTEVITSPAAGSATWGRGVTFTSTDAGSGVRTFTYVDGGVTRTVDAVFSNGSYSATVLPVEGQRQLTQIIATDGAGRTSGAVQGTYRIDRTAPATTAQAGNGGNYSLSAVDGPAAPNSGVAVTYCSSTSATSGFAACAGFTLGNKQSAWFYSVDNAGNTESVQSVTRG